MKYLKINSLIVFFISLFASSQLYSQDINLINSQTNNIINDSIPNPPKNIWKRLFFDEFDISLNKINYIYGHDNYEARNGFGIGLYHSFFKKHRSNLIVGIEFNSSSIFIKNYYLVYFIDGNYDFSNYNLLIKYNYLATPIGYRICLFTYKKVQLFIEPGVVYHLKINSTMLATKTLNQSNKITNEYVSTVTQFKNDAYISDYTAIYGGIGFKIPISKYELIFKVESKSAVSNSATETKWGLKVINYMRLNLGIKFH